MFSANDSTRASAPASRPDTVARVTVEASLGAETLSELVRTVAASGLALEGGSGRSGPYRLIGSFHQVRRALPEIRALLTRAGHPHTITLSPFLRAAA